MTQKRYLNLNAAAWQNMRRAWRPRWSAILTWQSFAVGPLLSGVNRLQAGLARQVRKHARLDGALVILGYWRSGTTLLHELLAAGGTWSYPTTQACMNPQSFLFASGRPTASAQRPMDDMVVYANSPQEDDFALLGLGARSPYEALLFPKRLKEALCLADPANLTPREQLQWREAFVSFLESVSGLQDGRPLLLKSPAHAFRIQMLRELLPNCRFVLVVRNPYHVFESSVRMWRRMAETYALTELPTDEVFRQIIIEHRMHFEHSLRAGLDGLKTDDYTVIRFEDLASEPVATVSALYRNLYLDGFESAAHAITLAAKSRAGYAPRSQSPVEPWAGKVRKEWADLFETYSYPTELPS